MWWISKKNEVEQERKQANLIFITCDQWRGDWINPERPIFNLPTIYKLARNGWMAERCYTSSPQCVPARISWITGLRPSEFGITQNKSVDLPGNSPSIVRELKNKGWHTAIVGKTHWNSHNKIYDLRKNIETLRSLGFCESIEIAGPRALQFVSCELTDEWKRYEVYKKHIDDMKERYKYGRNRAAWEVRETKLPNHLYPDIWIANKAEKMLKRMPTNKPWMLWISFVGPHEPFDTPLPWKGTHKDKDIPEIKSDDGWIDRLTRNCELKKIKASWKGKLNTRDIGDFRKDYADHLYLIDSQIRNIIKTVKKRSDYKNTAIAFTSDHGEMLGDHEMLYKSTFLEESIRVPFIYNEPSIGTIKRQGTKQCRPIGLTMLAKQMMGNLEKGGQAKDLEKWSKKQKGTISEFKGETMYIKEWDKIVYDKEGNIQWWTNLKKDKHETVNLMETDKLSEDQIMRLTKINKWAQSELKRKKNKNWIKLNLDN